jgi:hypothetical protein
MLTNVVIYGILDKQLEENFRYVITKSVDAVHEKENTFKVPCCFWTKNTKLVNLLTIPPIGTKVIIRGRLDSNDKYPVYVVVESIERVA